MNTYFATYRTEDFKSLLSDFHTYVDAILADDAQSNATLDRINELKQDGNQVDPISLVKERKLWKQYFPSAEGAAAQVDIAYTIKNLSKSRSLKIFLFEEESPETRTEAIGQFLKLIPREQYRLSKVDDRNFVLEKKLNETQLMRLMMDTEKASIPYTDLTNAKLVEPKKSQATEADNQEDELTPSYFEPLLGPTASALKSAKLSLGDMSGNVTGETKVKTTTPNRVTTEELREKEVQAKTQEEQQQQKLNQLRTEQARQQQLQQTTEPGNKVRSQTQAGAKQKQPGLMKNAGVVAAASAGVGALGGIPFFIRLFT